MWLRKTLVLLGLGALILFAGISVHMPPAKKEPMPTAEPSEHEVAKVVRKEHRNEGAVDPSAVSEEDRAATSVKVALLKEIIATGNDNDPRMDTEFKNLSVPTKDAFRTLYREQAAESLNARGTIVFLLSHEVATSDDARFLIEVLAESPCKSLQDCKTEVATPSTDSDANQEINLAYPQIVLSRLSPKIWEQIRDPELRSWFVRSVTDASQSKNTALAGVAQEAVLLIKGLEATESKAKAHTAE